MKTIKLLLILATSGILFNSCTVIVDDVFDNSISLEELMTSYDLWYVDYHRTSGTGDVPFMSKAFTISFLNGRFHANNNIADIGITGNGLGIVVGSYFTNRGLLEIHHDVDGRHDFDVIQVSPNEIRIYDSYQNVSYYLVGYQRNRFDYDMLFYENIEYFLQEYIAWERISIGNSGPPAVFDDENYLQFTPENNTTFYSSHDASGTNIDAISWDFTGSYQVYDVQGYQDLKILTLNYDSGDTEEFELSVINDGRVRLFNVVSGTTYDFSGRGFIRFLRGEKKAADLVRL